MTGIFFLSCNEVLGWSPEHVHYGNSDKLGNLNWAGVRVLANDSCLRMEAGGPPFHPEARHGRGEPVSGLFLCWSREQVLNPVRRRLQRVRVYEISGNPGRLGSSPGNWVGLSRSASTCIRFSSSCIFHISPDVTPSNSAFSVQGF